MGLLRPSLAHINPSSPRAAMWLRIFDGHTIPIKSPLAIKAFLEGMGEQMVYMLDLGALDKMQHERLVKDLAIKHALHERDVRDGLASHGMPVLAEDVGVSFDGRLVL